MSMSWVKRFTLFVLTVMPITIFVARLNQFSILMLSNKVNHQSMIRRRTSIIPLQGDCRFFLRRHSYDPETQTFITMYPSSGAEMMASLAKNSNLETVPVPKANKNSNSNTVKIANEFHSMRNETELETVNGTIRVMVLLINPIDALPSYFNYRHGVEIGHLPSRSTIEWEVWRDKHFHSEFQKWCELLLYWVQKRETKNRLLVSFSDIINLEKGPLSSELMADLLNEGEVIYRFNLDSTACIWSNKVSPKRKSTRDRKTRETKKETGGFNHTSLFTPDQMVFLIKSLELLSIKFDDDADLSIILSDYTLEISDLLEQRERTRLTGVKESV